MADLEELAGRLDHELPDVAWAEPERIRARGRDRSRQRSVVLAALGVLVIAAGAGWLATGVRSTPVTPPAVTPSASPPVVSPPAVMPSASPPERMLRPEDAGPDYYVEDYREFARGANPSWAFESNHCPSYAGLKLTAYRTDLWYGQELLLSKSGAAGVFTETKRFPPGKAAQVMADVERVTTACADWEIDRGGATTVQSYRVLDRDFAGDEALLVRLTLDVTDEKGASLESARMVLGVVRVADHVTVVYGDEGDGGGPDPVRLLIQRAADRLCALDGPC
jgi:hypothetical protein